MFENCRYQKNHHIPKILTLGTFFYASEMLLKFNCSTFIEQNEWSNKFDTLETHNSRLDIIN